MRNGGDFRPRNTVRAQELRRAATPAEHTLWRHLANRQLGVRFNRQMQVGPYFADFLCRSLGLVIELDGPSHDLQLGYDARRDRYLRDAGYTVLRFNNDDVRTNIEGVVIEIGLAIGRLTHP